MYGKYVCTCAHAWYYTWGVSPFLHHVYLRFVSKCLHLLSPILKAQRYSLYLSSSMMTFWVIVGFEFYMNQQITETNSFIEWLDTDEMVTFLGWMDLCSCVPEEWQKITNRIHIYLSILFKGTDSTGHGGTLLESRHSKGWGRRTGSLKKVWAASQDTISMSEVEGDKEKRAKIKGMNSIFLVNFPAC